MIMEKIIVTCPCCNKQIVICKIAGEISCDFYIGEETEYIDDSDILHYEFGMTGGANCE